MSSDIKCVLCGGKHFRKGYYDVNVDITLYTVDEFEHEIVTKPSIDLLLESEKKRDYSRGNHSKIYKYACENCGFIMSFTKEKNVESVYEEKERLKKERTYNWSNFK